MKPYSYYCYILFIFEIDPVGVGLPPLLWYFMYTSSSDMVLILSVYIYLKRFDVTFLEEKYSIKANLLGFKAVKLRSSHRRCSVKKSVIRNFAKFTGKHLRQSFFSNKVAGLSSPALLKMRLCHRCFSVNFAKFLRTPFYRTHLGDCFFNLSL